MIPITEQDDPRLEVFRGMGDSALKKNKQILVDSGKVVNRLLAQNYPIHKLLITDAYLASCDENMRSQMPKDTYIGSKAVIESIVGHKLHHGIIALASRPDDCLPTDFGDRIMILNGVNKAENVGSLVRSCHGFGFDTLIVDRDSCSPWVRRCIRVSMGSVFTMKTYHSRGLTDTINLLIKDGYFCLGASLSKESLQSIYRKLGRFFNSLGFLIV